MTTNLQTIEYPGVTKELAAMGVGQSFDPGPAWCRRILLLGNPGTGKSWWLYSIPGAIVLDPEDSGRDIPNKKARRLGPHTDPKTGKVVVPTVKDYQALIDLLVASAKKGKPLASMVVIDTLDEYVAMLCDEFCRIYEVPSVGDYKVKGAGWSIVKGWLMENLRKLGGAGYGIAIAGHMVEKTISIGGQDVLKVVPAISDSFKSALYRWCQHIFYTKKVTQTKTTYTEKVSAGKTLQIPKETKVKQFMISVRNPNTGEGEDESKSRIPIEEDLPVGVLGDTDPDGYGIWEKTYNDAVETITGACEGT